MTDGRTNSPNSGLLGDTDLAFAWPAVLDAALGTALLAVGGLLVGPAGERLDTATAGAVLLTIGAYNLYRHRRGRLEHPDTLRIAVLVGLWLVAFSLRATSLAHHALTAASVLIGAAVLCVNGVEYARRFKNRPDKRTRERSRGTLHLATLLAPSAAARERTRVAADRVRRALHGDALRLDVVAVLVGVVAGLGAVVFRLTIWLFQSLFFGAALNPGAVSFPALHVPNLFDALAPLGPLRFLAVPAVGGLLVGLVVKATTTAVRGHGVPEVLESLLTDHGRIDPRVSIYKTIASSVAIGSGASLGREGPIVQIGSAAGSYFGHFVDSRYTRTLVAAGAAGGIAATFNTPLAGILFALEVLLAEYYLKHVVVVVLSAVTATAVARSILGFTAAPGVHEFLVPVHYELLRPAVEFPLYALLGVVVAFVGAGATRLLYGVEHAFLRRLDLPAYAKPALGSALLGGSVLVAAAAAGVDSIQGATWLFGVGYGTIHAGIAGELSLAVLALLAVMKAVGFALSVGSGSSGGVFSPMLYVGAMVGGAFGILANGALTGVAGPGAYALVGTAGVFAAAASAPLTATLILFELTGQYAIILPLLVVTVVGSELCQFLLRGGTIYTEKLRDEGLTVQERRIGSLEDLTARDVMTADVDALDDGTPIEDALEAFQRTSHRGLPIVDGDRRVQGMLVRADVEDVLSMPEADDDRPAVANGGSLVVHTETEDPDVTPETPVEDIGVTDVVTATPTTNLLTLLDRMVSADVGRVPVVAPDGTLEGIVTRTDVMAAYDQIPVDVVADACDHGYGPAS